MGNPVWAAVQMGVGFRKNATDYTDFTDFDFLIHEIRGIRGVFGVLLELM
jgi:hypothetical protein